MIEPDIRTQPKSQQAFLVVRSKATNNMSAELLIQLGYALKAPESPTNATSGTLKNGQRFMNDMQRWKFVLDLPLIVLEQVHARHTCCLCHQEYNRDFQVCGPETACELPCGCCIGHLCAADWFSPYRKANTACPVCKFEIPELAKEPPSTMPRDAGLSQPTNLFRTSGWLRNQQTARDEDPELDMQLAALQMDTGLRFFDGDDSIEKLSLTLTDYLQKQDIKYEEQKAPRVGLRRRESSIASSAESELKRHGVPDFRGWGLARAALKAVDLMAKRSGA